jgi:hypothetical protein
MIDPNASDWSDLDLLTIDEASERLGEEIVTVERELAELRPKLADEPTLAASIALRERRLAALKQTRERLPAPGTFVLE